MFETEVNHPDPTIRTEKKNLYFTIMKKYLLWICAVGLLSAGSSCSDNAGVDSVGRVAIEQEALTAVGEGETVPLNVTSNAYWHIEFSDPETGETVRWVTASETRGTGDAVVMLNVARNRSTTARTTYVHVITDSESSNVSILLTQSGSTVGGGDGYSLPIYQTYSIDTNKELDNAFIEGTTCYFDNGLILRRTGSNATMVFSTQTHTNPKTNWEFQRGVVIDSWATDDALILEFPLRNELSGDLRYSWGSRRDNAQSTNPWTYWWSADGKSWTQFEGTAEGGVSDAVWKTIDFTIPADKKIPAGGKLYIRHLCTDGTAVGSSSNKTAAFQTGFCITKAAAAKSTVAAMNDQTVVFSTGFDDLVDTKAAYIDLPLDFMSSWNAGGYSLPKALSEIVEIKEAYSRPGFLQIGRGDEAVVSRYTQGSYTIKLTSRFETMNILKANLKLTFLATAMMDAYGNPTNPGVVVTTDETSGATVEGGTLSGMANNSFKPFTVQIKGATAATQITITSAAMSSTTDDVRFFLDDILLEVEGTPERPSPTDPTKVAVSAIRALKGNAEVSVTDNYYIEGRVVAVNNVPSECFAMQDDASGIFVKKANHGLAAGDLVKVIVKGAKLATSEGLLTVTPATADLVSKESAANLMPTAKSISVAELKAGTYEGMYVSLPESQIVAADLSKTMSGNVTLELADQTTTYTLKTFAAASFATQTVPQKSGAPKGVAGSTFLLPTALSDLAAMTGTRFGASVYAITPICGMLKVVGNPLSTIYNATYDEASMTVTYTDNGCTITKLGNSDVTGSGLTCKASPYDGRFQTTGWGGVNWQENALLFKIKATSVLKGNLRFGFGLFAASSALVPHNYKIEWSTNQTSWHSDMDVRQAPYNVAGNNKFSIPTAANAYGYKMALFNVPESSAVTEGRFLFIRISQADTECHKSGSEISTSGQLQFQHAFYLTTNERRAYHTTKFASGDNVVLTEGFDDAFFGHDYFIPTWQMSASSNAPNKYTAAEGWLVNDLVYELPGYIRLGSSDATSGTITTPALTALGDTPTNITFKFKIAIHMGGASSYKPDPTTLTVTTEGDGTAAEPVHSLASLPAESMPADEAAAKVMEKAYYQWYPVTVKVTGATKTTKITIGGTGRHYIDDIVITKD